MPSKKKKSRWLDRTLVQSHYHYALCKSEKAFQEELDHLNIPHEKRPLFLDPTADACVHYFENTKTNSQCAIVCINKKALKDVDPLQIVGILVHEAVHIWQHDREFRGEREPSHEFEAYSIQAIAQNLIEAYGKP